MKLIIIFLFSFVASCEKDHSQNLKESQLGLLWSYFTEFSSAPTAEPLLIDNAIFITGGLALHKVSNLDGSRIWMKSISGTASSLRNDRFVYNENTIIGLQPYKIHAFDMALGDEVWTTVFPDSLNLYTLSMGARFENTAYYNTVRGYLLKVDMLTGKFEILQKFPFKFRNINVFDNGDLLIPYEQSLSDEPPFPYRAVMGRWRPTTKEWIWEYELKSGGNFSILYPQIENNIVYSGLTNAGFIAIDATTGKEIWKTIKTGLITGFHVLTPDTIYASALNFLYALDRHTGVILWETEPMGISESTRIHYKNGYVYWCHNNGIFIYDVKDGKQVHYQRHDFGGYIWTSTMAEDRLLVQTSTHLLAYELFNPEE